MKRIIAILAILVVFALAFASCEASVNNEDDLGNADLNNEINNTDDTEPSEDTEDNDENPDKEQEGGSDGENANAGNDAENSDSSDDTDNSNNSDSSDSSGNSSSSDNSGSGNSDNSSNNNAQEWIEPVVELQEPITVGDYQLALNVEGTEYTIVKYMGEDEDLTIISEHEGIPVTRIGEQAFAGNWRTKTIIIPNSFTTIEYAAFNSCYGLICIEIPETLVYIGAHAFAYCEFENITVKEGNPRYISTNNCLIDTSTKTIIKGCHTGIIPDDGSVENIIYAAFSFNNKLINVFIPGSIKNIEKDAFYSCPNIESVTVDEGNTVYSSSNNCLIETAAKKIIFGCKNSTIPSDGSVTVIDDYAFPYYNSKSSLVIPACIEKIGNASIMKCNGLESIIVEQGNPTYHSDGNCLIETATKKMILGCKNSVIPADGSVTSISRSAFDGQSDITSIVIPESVTFIDGHVFYCCDNISEIVLPDGIDTINPYTFYSGNNITVVIPSSVTLIDNSAFGWSENVTIKFKGTEEEWNAINKHTDWNCNTADEDLKILFNQ